MLRKEVRVGKFKEKNDLYDFVLFLLTSMNSLGKLMGFTAISCRVNSMLSSLPLSF